MKMPFGTEVDLRAGHIVLDGLPALLVRRTASPSFRPMSIGHGRPSQLLLSSCWVILHWPPCTVCSFTRRSCILVDQLYSNFDANIFRGGIFRTR